MLPARPFVHPQNRCRCAQNGGRLPVQLPWLARIKSAIVGTNAFFPSDCFRLVGTASSSIIGPPTHTSPNATTKPFSTITQPDGGQFHSRRAALAPLILNYGHCTLRVAGGGMGHEIGSDGHGGRDSREIGSGSRGMQGALTCCEVVVLAALLSKQEEVG